MYTGHIYNKKPVFLSPKTGVETDPVTGEHVLPAGIVNGDGQAAAAFIREKSAHDTLNGKLGSKVASRYWEKLADRLRSFEHSELAGTMYRISRDVTKTSLSRAKDMLVNQSITRSMADGWPVSDKKITGGAHCLRRDFNRIVLNLIHVVGCNFVHSAS